MKVAIMSIPNLEMIDIAPFIPRGATELLIGHIRSILHPATEYAKSHGLPFRIYKPDYRRFRSAAPVICYRQMIREADWLIAFGSEEEQEISYMAKYARDLRKVVHVYTPRNFGFYKLY